MSNTIEHAVKDAKHAIHAATNGAGELAESANQSVKGGIGSALHGAERLASKARSSWIDGVTAVTGLIMSIGSIPSRQQLSIFGLRRRRSLVDVAALGGAFAIGVGAGVLLAPMSGVELRRKIGRYFTNALGRGGAKDPPAATTENGAAVRIAHKISSRADDDGMPSRADGDPEADRQR
ncbi:MAG: YtxH domain-containing protein [Myxococcales bacterium]|nr:YtxH domain-containing protein [Myxococcales bacterium]